MLAEMIDKIVSLRKAETFEIGGETYATEKLVCSSSKNVSKRSPKRLAPWST